jgi:hypothetical protein
MRPAPEINQRLISFISDRLDRDCYGRPNSREQYGNICLSI